MKDKEDLIWKKILKQIDETSDEEFAKDFEKLKDWNEIGPNAIEYIDLVMKHHQHEARR